MPAVLRGTRGLVVSACFAIGVLAPATATAETVITVLGDSNVVGKNVSPSEAYPAKLERALKARGVDARVVSSGVNGEISSTTLARAESSMAANTKVAVVWVGINDIKRGIPQTQVRGNVQAIASRLTARGIKVVVITPDKHADLHKQAKYVVTGDPEIHLNPSGHDVVVARTISQVIAAAK